MSTATMDRTSQSQSNENKANLIDKPQSNKRSTDWGNQHDPEFEPDKQNSGVDAGKPGNPNTPTIKNEKQSETELHPAIMPDDRLKASGKMSGGLPNEPIVSINPTTSATGAYDAPKPEAISDALEYLLDQDFGSPYEDVHDLETGDGLLIQVQPNKTLDQTVLEAQKQVYRLNQYYSTPVLNDEGETILDMVVIEEFKRNDDGTIDLNYKGKPKKGANFRHVPRVVQLRSYAVKSVTKDDKKITADGALIVRVF